VTFADLSEHKREQSFSSPFEVCVTASKIDLNRYSHLRDIAPSAKVGCESVRRPCAKKLVLKSLIFWTDSMIVIDYISNDSNSFKSLRQIVLATSARFPN
jgi:hypothetical protein